jgi:hypothetical protein
MTWGARVGAHSEARTSMATASSKVSSWLLVKAGDFLLSLAQGRLVTADCSFSPLSFSPSSRNLHAFAPETSRRTAA